METQTQRDAAVEPERAQDGGHEAVIQSFYREILGREPDAGGMATYQKLIAERGLPMAIRSMLRSFTASNEYRNRVLARGVQSVGLAQGEKTVNGQKIEHVISLGTHCQASSILKSAGLKPSSFPFDWLFSSPRSVVHCLKTDFGTLLDRKYYRSLSGIRKSGEPGANHQWYLDTYGVRDMFAHRDPTRDEDYNYTVRTVERFRSVMAGNGGKLFVMIARPQHDLQADFYSVAQAIDQATSNAAGIYIQLREPSNTAEHRCIRRLSSNGYHQLYEFMPASEELGIGFHDPVDNAIVMRLISQYAIDTRSAF
ncbi:MULTISPECIES: DUF1796 family putative cysteine peptidase [Cupriavidus]|mgnify:CR=1 FL=1|uniref:DUF4214 domain-containing protein n=1 Tax=Cupriavidus metallidurans TaxID=119219 RepID=A0A482J2S1_9BURK|nr:MULTISPECIES: DUF1796 family putative cysteine peptidase [Cupriavidus]KWR71424.1 hypothetical protein RN01_31605 [Cupriavidus sp. SHE]QBP13839.1 DUF4214 domain-containing protein [Cupriavidus metallidurans]QWC91616.1 DUF4214 domain-containing protein [Cupriavidus metallidurans]